VTYAIALFGFATVFCLKLLYFDVDTKTLNEHALRWRAVAGVFWAMVQPIFLCSLAIIGSGLEMMCENELQLTFDADRARWYVCGGVAVSCLCLVLIRVSHKAPDPHRDPHKQRVLTWISRLQFALHLLMIPSSLLLGTIQTSSISVVAASATLCLILVVANLLD